LGKGKKTDSQREEVLAQQVGREQWSLQSVLSENNAEGVKEKKKRENTISSIVSGKGDEKRRLIRPRHERRGKKGEDP